MVNYIDLQLSLTQQKLAQVKKQQTTINLMIEMLAERIDVLERMKTDKNYLSNIEICKKKIPPQA